MTPWHGQHQSVVVEGKRLQAGGAHVAGDDADIGLAFVHRLDDLAAGKLAQVDVHRRVLGQELAQRLRQEFGHGGGVGEDAHMALDAFRELLQLGPEMLDLRQDQPGVLQQGVARRRQRNAALGSVKQLRAERSFQVLDAGAVRLADWATFTNRRRSTKSKYTGAVMGPGDGIAA